MASANCSPSAINLLSQKTHPPPHSSLPADRTVASSLTYIYQHAKRHHLINGTADTTLRVYWRSLYTGIWYLLSAELLPYMRNWGRIRRYYIANEVVTDRAYETHANLKWFTIVSCIMQACKRLYLVNWVGVPKYLWQQQQGVKQNKKTSQASSRLLSE